MDIKPYIIALLSQWPGDPPSNLSYSEQNATYTVGTAITTNVPSVTGVVTSYSVSPDLPSGLAINTETGEINGTPTTSSSGTSYTITASNSNGSATTNISITVNESSTTTSASISYSGSPFSYSLGQAVIETPTISGGISPTVCAASPILPTGIFLDSTTCVISGTTTGTQSATDHTITVTYSGGSISTTINITVNGGS